MGVQVQILLLVSADFRSLMNNVITSVRTRTFPRMVDHQDMTFDDEPTLPKLNNLATHTAGCKKRSEDRSTDTDCEELPSSGRLNVKQSADFMAAYLKAGELNPDLIPTQRGFLRLFSAWILDESLPWTSGEAPSLALLFKYLKIKFQLPSDTTVRNQLAKIFTELHGKVVREFMVCSLLLLYIYDNLIYIYRMSHLRLHMLPTPGRPDKWYIRLPAQSALSLTRIGS